MKTMVEIEDKVLNEVVNLTGAKNKKKAILVAIDDYLFLTLTNNSVSFYIERSRFYSRRVIMSSHIKKPPLHLSKSQALRKISRSTKRAVNSTILPLLSERGAEDISLTELRKCLSDLSTPLSMEIIQERNRDVLPVGG